MTSTSIPVIGTVLTATLKVGHFHCLRCTFMFPLSVALLTYSQRLCEMKLMFVIINSTLGGLV